MLSDKRLRAVTLGPCVVRIRLSEIDDSAPPPWRPATVSGYAELPVQRTVFATSRASEFLELRAIQAQTGQPEDAFGHVVVKELLDNALDAAESADRAPVIEISTRTDGEHRLCHRHRQRSRHQRGHRGRHLQLRCAGVRQGPLPWPVPRCSRQRL